MFLSFTPIGEVYYVRLVQHVELATKLKPNISLEVFRRQLATVDAQPQLALLGFITGLVTAAVILCFRWLIDSGLSFLPEGQVDNFEGLDPMTRGILVLSGAVLLGLMLQRYRPSARRVGVVHVMERLSLHQGNLPLKNAVIQFFGGALALMTGQSGGREGPAIHLGATAASLLGRASKLPYNSLRTMVACGTAAAIASSFNTPIAGVIFALEVIMMEYTIANFIPVIVAAVTSTLVTQFVYGNEPAFVLAPLEMHSALVEIPYLVIGGILIGALAAGYIQLIQTFARLSEQPLWQRITLAGAITACVAVFIPQVMGVGYDTVNQLMLTHVSIVIVLVIMVAKLVTSAAAVGLGMPVGLIGPSLFIGASAGSIFGSLLGLWQGADVSTGFYVILGMCAMMGAVLQAPLAALMTVMELTANTTVILPAMVIIVVASLVTSQVFKQRSVYITTLNTLGLQYPPSPVTLHLERVGVTAIMDRSFTRLPAEIDIQTAKDTLARQLKWIVVEDQNSQPTAVMNPSDLDAFLETLSERVNDAGKKEAEAVDFKIRLLQIPGRRRDVTTIGSQSTVMQLQQHFDKTESEACCVTRTSAPLINPVIGVVTRGHIDNYRNTSS